MEKNILGLIGNTPIVKLNKLGENIYLKLEGKNPGGSIKDRAVLKIVETMEKNREIDKDTILIEATSGNFGISLAMIGKIKGYRVNVVMPESMSQERKDLIKAYGAELILTSAEKGMQGAVDKVNEIIKENKNYKGMEQFKNPANQEAHYEKTGAEIYKEIPDIDIFVAGIGTGGTITGTARFLKEKNKNIKIIGVEPKTSPMISEGYAGAHKIQGIGANFVPELLDKNLIDEYMLVSSEDAFKTAKLLMREEGISAGISSGANVFAAIEISKKYPNKKIVTISPDGAEKYISMGILD